MTRYALAFRTWAVEKTYMDYPLGSFARFGHQEGWAIENSVAARQAMAAGDLMPDHGGGLPHRESHKLQMQRCFSVNVELHLGNMLRFLSQSFSPLTGMFERVGGIELEIMDHTGAVMRYFDLPTGMVPR